MNLFKPGDRVRLLRDLSYHPHTKAGTEHTVHSTITSKYARPYVYVIIGGTPVSVFEDNLQAVGIRPPVANELPLDHALDALQYATHSLQSKRSDSDVCTCPLHGPDGLMAVGCRCNAIKKAGT